MKRSCFAKRRAGRLWQTSVGNWARPKRRSMRGRRKICPSGRERLAPIASAGRRERKSNYSIGEVRMKKRRGRSDAGSSVSCCARRTHLADNFSIVPQQVEHAALSFVERLSVFIQPECLG